MRLTAYYSKLIARSKSPRKRWSAAMTLSAWCTYSWVFQRSTFSSISWAWCWFALQAPMRTMATCWCLCKERSWPSQSFTSAYSLHLTSVTRAALNHSPGACSWSWPFWLRLLLSLLLCSLRSLRTILPQLGIYAYQPFSLFSKSSTKSKELTCSQSSLGRRQTLSNKAIPNHSLFSRRQTMRELWLKRSKKRSSQLPCSIESNSPLQSNITYFK